MSGSEFGLIDLAKQMGEIAGLIEAVANLSMPHDGDCPLCHEPVFDYSDPLTVGAHMRRRMARREVLAGDHLGHRESCPWLRAVRLVGPTDD